MAKFAVYFLGAVFLCQIFSVLSQNGVTTTSTTTPSPEFRNCIANCPALPQYNPVCGTNGVSYPNRQRMECAQQCGINVQVAHIGTCGPSPGGK